MSERCKYCSLKDGEEKSYDKSWIVRKYGGFYLACGDDYFTPLKYCPYCGRDFSKAAPTEKIVNCFVTVYYVDENKHTVDMYTNDICCSDETVIKEIVPQECKDIFISSLVKMHFIDSEQDVIGLELLNRKVKDFIKSHNYYFSLNIYAYPFGFPETAELDNLVKVYYCDDVVTNSKCIEGFFVSDATFKTAIEYFGGTLKGRSEICANGEMAKENDLLSDYLGYDEKGYAYIDIVHCIKPINP